MARRNARRKMGWKDRALFLARRFWIAPVVATLFIWAGAWLWPEGGISGAGKSLLRFSAEKGFVVSSVLIEGRVHANPESLKDAVSVRRGDPIFGFGLSDLRARVEEIPWVRTARVERRLPDILYIRLEERKPVALWQKDGELALVDRDGVVLETRDLARFSNLPMVAGVEAQFHAKDLADMIGAEPEIARRLEVAQWVGDRRWTLHMKGGAVVLLPEDDPEAALRRIAQEQAREKVFDSGLVAEIDARIPGKMTVRARRDEAANSAAALAPAAGKQKN